MNRRQKSGGIRLVRAAEYTPVVVPDNPGETARGLTPAPAAQSLKVQRRVEGRWLPVETQRHRIQTPVGELVVRTLGAPEAPVAVLWHSLFVDDRSWGRLTPHLTGDRRLVSITGPGHGSSTDLGARYTLSDCAAAAITVLEHLGIHDAVDWVGNAWGGHVGIVFAQTRPDRTRTLVTIGAPVHAYPPTEARKTRALLAAYRLAGPTGFIQDAVSGALLAATTRDVDPSAVSRGPRLFRDRRPDPDGPRGRVRFPAPAGPDAAAVPGHRPDAVDHRRRAPGLVTPAGP